MDMAFKKGARWLLLLVLLGSASAFAWPGGERGSDPALQAVQFRPYGQERGDGRNGNPQGDHRRSRDDGDFQRQRRDAQGNSDDAGRRGRMTPDERRALRRQIDEAGQDIYRSKR